MSDLSRTALQTEIDTKAASGIKMPAVDLRSILTDMADSAQHLDDGSVLKFKKLTGTTGAAEGGSTELSHGLPDANIISAQLLITYAAGSNVPHEHTQTAGYQAHLAFTTGSVWVVNHVTSSENILSKPFTVLITYSG